MNIINITQPGHQFYPGQVVMRVTPDGGGSVVTITGSGSGPNPVWNDVVGYLFFWVDGFKSIYRTRRAGRLSIKEGAEFKCEQF